MQTVHSSSLLELERHNVYSTMSKRKALTLENKVKVIRLSDGRTSSRRLAADFGVCKTQINRVVKARDTQLA